MEAGELYTPNLPTKFVPTNIAWLKLSGRSPMGLGIPPLQIKITLESNPQRSTMLVGCSVIISSIIDMMIDNISIGIGIGIVIMMNHNTISQYYVY